MVPHQHLRAPEKWKTVSEGRLYVNWIPTVEALKKTCLEEWKKVGGHLTEEQNAFDVPAHITTMAHDDESPAGLMNFTQNSIEALHRRSLFGYKARLEVVPWKEENRVTPLRQMETVLSSCHHMRLHGASFKMMVDSGSARRGRGPPPTHFWWHEPLSMKMAVVATTHHSTILSCRSS